MLAETAERNIGYNKDFCNELFNFLTEMFKDDMCLHLQRGELYGRWHSCGRYKKIERNDNNDTFICCNIGITKS